MYFVLSSEFFEGPPDPTFLLVVKQVGTNPPRFSGHGRMTPSKGSIVEVCAILPRGGFCPPLF